MKLHGPLYRKLTYFTAFLSLGLGIFTVVVILIYRYFGPFGHVTCEEFLQDTAIEFEFQEEVSSIAEAANGYRIVHFVSGNHPLKLCPDNPSYQLLSWIVSGDSLVKMQGQTHFTARGVITEREENYPYPCCR
ncbi:hypothetical protein [Pontibacter sp. G13]|uniref:hypothetical protein n=1 Tax=Pontibacter sp. G13 TaxID=3074898 RepID=UPI00288A0CED|nr:hypothetical protein [Pontibacter sp. G13]WNJ18605.1 hypothetical protein RJD25_27430 [Pontibacter sp. G13]